MQWKHIREDTREMPQYIHEAQLSRGIHYENTPM